MSSYFVEAEHYARQDKIVEAQQLLTRLADDFPKSAYAPYALYQAAFLAERLGQVKDLQDANQLIERLVTTYPDQPLVFEARLKQGDLMRKLNRFPLAEQDYQSLINNYSRNPDVILARLALAETYNAQSAGDPSPRTRRWPGPSSRISATGLTPGSTCGSRRASISASSTCGAGGWTRPKRSGGATW